MIIPNTIEDLLIDFDEKGFMPKNLIPYDTEEYARAWKLAFVEAIEAERKGMLKDCIESNKATEEITRSRTAREILSEIIKFTDSSFGVTFCCIEDMDFEDLCDEIAQRYGVEVK